MGPAISHLLTLTVSLPAILPHSPEDIHTEVRTGSVDLRDEIVPDNEDEDIYCRTRIKSSLSVIIRIGGGDAEDLDIVDSVDQVQKGKEKTKTRRKRGQSQKKDAHTNGAQPVKATLEVGLSGGDGKAEPERVVYSEADLEMNGGDDSEKDEMDGD